MRHTTRIYVYEATTPINVNDNVGKRYSDYVVFVNQENSALPNLALTLTLTLTLALTLTLT